MTRMDIKSWRKSRNGKAYAVRVGSTWTNEKGVTYLEFDALPLPDEQGRVSCFLEEPRERVVELAASPKADTSYSSARGLTAKLPKEPDEMPF